MNDADISKILTDVKEGLVVHPGDQLVLSFSADLSAENADYIQKQILRKFGSTGIEVMIVVGAEQIAVIRQDDEAFAKRVRDIVWREARRGRVAWPKP